MPSAQSMESDLAPAMDGKESKPLGKEAWLYSCSSGGKVHCGLCSQHCVIPDGKSGVCGVRFNSGGILFSRVYGRVISLNLDPIEKKPLYHFFPGSTSYSIATPGCNFRCKWCQNWSISQMPREKSRIAGEWVPPEQIVADANALGCRSIAYTYTEPTIFFEYVYDTAYLGHSSGLDNVLVTNGFMSKDMLRVIHKYVDGVNVDLKAFNDRTYIQYIGGRLQPVLDNLIAMKEMGMWVEVTTLIVPEVNDDPEELRDIARFIVYELGSDTPWHISRFFPTYKLADRSPTPMATLDRARDIGREEGLTYIYIGNAEQGEGNDTICPNCGRVVIRRHGFTFIRNELQGGFCPTCGSQIPGVGM
jgi:pyruvate formate lyase activating enzyme